MYSRHEQRYRSFDDYIPQHSNSYMINTSRHRTISSSNVNSNEKSHYRKVLNGSSSIKPSRIVTPYLSKYYDDDNDNYSDYIPQHTNHYFNKTSSRATPSTFATNPAGKKKFVHYGSQYSMNSTMTSDGSASKSPSTRPTSPFPYHSTSSSYKPSKFCPVHYVPVDRPLVLHTQVNEPFYHLVSYYCLPILFSLSHTQI